MFPASSCPLAAGSFLPLPVHWLLAVFCLFLSTGCWQFSASSCPLAADRTSLTSWYAYIALSQEVCFAAGRWALKSYWRLLNTVMRNRSPSDSGSRSLYGMNSLHFLSEPLFSNQLAPFNTAQPETLMSTWNKAQINALKLLYIIVFTFRCAQTAGSIWTEFRCWLWRFTEMLH